MAAVCISSLTRFVIHAFGTFAFGSKCNGKERKKKKQTSDICFHAFPQQLRCEAGRELLSKENSPRILSGL